MILKTKRKEKKRKSWVNNIYLSFLSWSFAITSWETSVGFSLELFSLLFDWSLFVFGLLFFVEVCFDFLSW